MPTTFFDANGNYYETLTDISVRPGHTVAPKKPSADHQWIGGEWVYVEPPVVVPSQMTFAQLLIGLVAEGWITEQQGDNWLQGVLPAQVTQLVAGLPVNQRFAARARAARPSIVLRSDTLVNALAAAQGITQEQLDQFFVTYSQV